MSFREVRIEVHSLARIQLRLSNHAVLLHLSDLTEGQGDRQLGVCGGEPRIQLDGSLQRGNLVCVLLRNQAAAEGPRAKEMLESLRVGGARLRALLRDASRWGGLERVGGATGDVIH